MTTIKVFFCYIFASFAIWNSRSFGDSLIPDVSVAKHLVFILFKEINSAFFNQKF